MTVRSLALLAVTCFAAMPAVGEATVLRRQLPPVPTHHHRWQIRSTRRHLLRSIRQR
jgi:hypothetical protein